jgi:predicted dehydrogenase
VTRLGVVGAGRIGSRHVEEILQCPAAALAGIVDVTPAGSKLASDAGAAFCESLVALLRDVRPDGVVIATPNALHAPQALACIAAGVPALVEKPLAHSLVEALAICEAAERADVPILVGHHRMHSPIVQVAYEIVHSGELGQLVGVMGSAVFYKPDAYFDEGPWRRHAGGGPILINMIHEIASLRRLVGEIDAVQAFASNAVRGFAVEDTVAIALRFANGALGTFLLSDTGASPRSWEQTSQENPEYAAYPDQDCYTIIGTRGSLDVPTMRMAWYEDPRARSWFLPFAMRKAEVARNDPLGVQLAHFVDVVQGKAKPLVTARDGLANLRIVEAIVEAAKTGCLVDTRA